MDAFLAHGDSLRLLRLARVTPGVRLASVDDYVDGIVDLGLLREALPRGMRGFDANHPLRLRFSSRARRSQVRGISPSVGVGPGLVLAGFGEKGVRLIVEAPALALVSAASDLLGLVGKGEATRDEALVRLTALCMELCGSYSRDPWRPLAGECGYGMAPLCDTAQILVDLDGMRGRRGVDLARRAARLAGNGSASSYETLLYLAFCLPISLGGLKLDPPRLNERVEWPREARHLVGHRSMRPDLFWPDAMVACEYNGGGHAEDERRREDDLRIQDYQTCGIKVFPANANDVASEPALRGYLWRVVSALAASQPPAFLRRMRRALDGPTARKRRTDLLRWVVPKRPSSASALLGGVPKAPSSASAENALEG